MKKDTLTQQILHAEGMELDKMAKRFSTMRLPNEEDGTLRERILTKYADLREIAIKAAGKEKSHESTTNTI